MQKTLKIFKFSLVDNPQYFGVSKADIFGTPVTAWECWISLHFTNLQTMNAFYFIHHCMEQLFPQFSFRTLYIFLHPYAILPLMLCELWQSHKTMKADFHVTGLQMMIPFGLCIWLLLIMPQLS